MIKKIFSTLLVAIVFAGIFSFGAVFATPPSAPYAPGETKDPNCSVGDTNCSVTAPVPYQGALNTLNLGIRNFITNGIARFGYDASNYATVSTDKNGNMTIATKSSSGQGSVMIDSAIAGDATILSQSGTMVLGGVGGGNNENVKLDFETYKDKIAVTSDTGVTTLDLGSLNLITSGQMTMGQSTPGTLVTRVKNGTPSESDDNGSLVVDSANGRLYFRYGSAWHYIAQTAGFQIPNYEIKDPISGEQIKEGDLVIGKIDQTVKDGALHGVWTKASNIVASLGITAKDGVTLVKNMIADKITAKVARVNKLEMVDQATGGIYCMWVENDAWKKERGGCK